MSTYAVQRKEKILDDNRLDFLDLHIAILPTSHISTTCLSQFLLFHSVAKTGLGRARSRFPYKARNPDELSFDRGVELIILSTEEVDPDWWRGMSRPRGDVTESGTRIGTLAPKGKTKRSQSTRSNASPFYLWSWYGRQRVAVHVSHLGQMQF